MDARRLPSGHLLVPMRAESDDGAVVGDGLVEIAPGHPLFHTWDTWLQDRPDPDAPASSEPLDKG